MLPLTSIHNSSLQTIITPFTQLPYFKDLKLPYNIDVMHTKKNVAESLFNTILNIPAIFYSK